MSKIIDHIAKTGDVKPLMAVDAWAWAYYSKLKLVGGPFTVAGNEFQIEILQDDFPRQCACKATQMTMTEAYVLKILHGLIKRRYPRGGLYLFPTVDDVTDFSASRFQPLINDNHQAIGRFVRDTNRANLKRIGRAYLYFRGARLSQKIAGETKASSKLVSIPVDIVIFDELDLMSPGATNWALARMAKSEIKEEVYLGNPTIPDYGIDKVYKSSDQRVWFIKCEACGEWTCLELEFPNCLKRQPDGSVIRACKKCEREIIPRNGQWVARYPDRSEYMHGRWISHLNSITVDPKSLLDDWENPERDTALFYNLKLGMAYIATENRLTANDIYECCGNDPMFSSHKGPCAMGVDVQGERKGFHVVIGCRESAKTVRILYVGRLGQFSDIHDVARRFNIGCAVFDQEPETRAVKAFAKEESYPIFLCKYKESQRKAPLFDEEEGLVSINRTEACDETHDLVVDSKTNFVLPRRNSEIIEYATQMCNTAKVLQEDEDTGSRRYIYRKLGSDDYYHATNYLKLALSRVGIASSRFSRIFRPIRKKAKFRPRQRMAA